ncbi:MAG TPA: 3'-5' exonuclease, partial [Candidatus Nitrosotalea sp.]|nr:3'-5' exonuclease [Candidatus Nitrosotalea sp.]
QKQHQVWDSRIQRFRSVRWSDIVILLRSLRNKAETYAKEFHRVGVPLEAERTGFYDNTEVTDLLSLLQLLDNPIQDVPLLAVLRSPLVGLSLNELAAIRLAARGTHLWTALKRWQDAERQKAPKGAAMLAKVDSFLERYKRWRRVGRERSLSQQLESVLDETHYREWLQTQPRAEQRLANLRHLLVLSQRFDPFQRQGVQRFLRFVEAQRGVQVDSEPAPVDAVDAVRLMSIHKSKGLEFPVVVLAGLGTRFNMRDLSDQMVLDEEYGLCPQIKPAPTGPRYPSLPWWLAGKRQRREALGEEMRLLYVAMTRARDTLLLVGTVSGEKTLKSWIVSDEGRLTDRRILKARGYLDWLGPLLTGLKGDPNWTNQTSGTAELFRWSVDRDEGEFVREAASTESGFESERLRSIYTEADTAALGRLKNRIEWQYPFAAAGNEPAKTSVSAIRRRAGASEDEARKEFRIDIDAGRRWIRTSDKRRPGELSAAEAGTAHHQFLQAVALERTGTEAELRREAERLRGIGVLSTDEISALDFAALDAFWQSETGRGIRAQASRVRRELPFTARMSPEDLEAVGLRKKHPGIENEFFVVQGAVDLAVILPDAISILDFKTDRVTVGELEERTRFHTPQLRLYARALEKIYRRPVKAAELHFLALHRTVTV